MNATTSGIIHTTRFNSELSQLKVAALQVLGALLSSADDTEQVIMCAREQRLVATAILRTTFLDSEEMHEPDPQPDDPAPPPPPEPQRDSSPTADRNDSLPPPDTSSPNGDDDPAIIEMRTKRERAERILQATEPPDGEDPDDWLRAKRQALTELVNLMESPLPLPP